MAWLLLVPRAGDRHVRKLRQVARDRIAHGAAGGQQVQVGRAAAAQGGGRRPGEKHDAMIVTASAFGAPS